jgi:hypothetical protein
METTRLADTLGGPFLYNIDVMNEKDWAKGKPFDDFLQSISGVEKRRTGI